MYFEAAWHCGFAHTVFLNFLVTVGSLSKGAPKAAQLLSRYTHFNANPLPVFLFFFFARAVCVEGLRLTYITWMKTAKPVPPEKKKL